MLPSGNLTAMGNSDTLTFATAGPSTRKWDNAPESESAYFTSFTNYLVLNIMYEWGDWLRLPSLAILIHNSCFDCARGLLASFTCVRLVLASTLLFHFSAVLFTVFIPHGSISWGMVIVGCNEWSASCLLLAVVSWSVLGLVDAVASSSTPLPLLDKFEANTFASSS